jgi:Peptidase family M1 domain
MKILYNSLSVVCLCMLSLISQAQTPKAPYKSSKFEQLGTELPTPNSYRTADGSPGPDYWQQKADYKIKAELNDDNQSIKGSETITYFNNSPQDLAYLWLQLDQNLFDKESNTVKTNTMKLGENPDFSFMAWSFAQNSNGGFKILSVKDEKGNPMQFSINKTMMRIDMPQALKAKGGKVVFSVEWSYNIVNVNKQFARGGYEYFPKDGNYLYEIAQWFPRMAVFSDVTGWQNKQFLGAGEFALVFGDYEVELTVPADHIVGATGELQNADKVLTAEQRQRWKQAETSDKPVVIVTQAEATEKEKAKSKDKKTWIYKAKNVRDFAFATSRKFIWDAFKVQVGNNKVWAMSYYPKEGNPLWGEYSTNVVALTLKVYSRYTIDYPYPVAISVHGPVFGMEYPMICFNGGRPQADGTVPDQTRHAMVGVIIHEVGHNFFPMIVNSDERQWTWMDEGLNSFCEYLTEVEVHQQSWAMKDYKTQFPSRRGPAKNIVPYMKSDPSTLEPIMTNSEQIQSLGNNAYGKAATALNILRETVMGRELFDFAFKKYAQKWAFKHPEPADFFRTLEDASAVDLDWFWRGWFYTTEPCDIALEAVRLVRFSEKSAPQGTASIDSPIPTTYFKASNLEEALQQMQAGGRGRGGAPAIEIFTTEEKAMFHPSKYFYELKLKNIGGLIMPVIIQINYTDGTKEIQRIPAEIWRKSPEEIYKVLMTDKAVASFSLDPLEETADIDTGNNTFPRQANPSKFEELKNNK